MAEKKQNEVEEGYEKDLDIDRPARFDPPGETRFPIWLKVVWVLLLGTAVVYVILFWNKLPTPD